MAGRALLVHNDKNTITVTVDAHVDKVLQMARERELAVTSVEDVACYRVANFEVPNFSKSRVQVPRERGPRGGSSPK